MTYLHQGNQSDAFGSTILVVLVPFHFWLMNDKTLSHLNTTLKTIPKEKICRPFKYITHSMNSDKYTKELFYYPSLKDSRDTVYHIVDGAVVWAYSKSSLLPPLLPCTAVNTALPH